MNCRTLVGSVLIVALPFAAASSEPVTLGASTPTGTHSVLSIAAGRISIKHVPDEPLAAIDLTGEGFSLRATIDPLSSRSRAVDLPTIDPSFAAAGAAFGRLATGGRTLEFAWPSSSIHLVLTAPIQQIPADTDLEFFSVSYPFALSGTLRGVSVSGSESVYSLSGAGTGISVFVEGGLLVDSYLNLESPTPVPEPASLLLFSTGAASLLLARFRRRRGSEQPED